MTRRIFERNVALVYPRQFEAVKSGRQPCTGKFVKEGLIMHIGIDLDNTILDATTSHLHYYNIASGIIKTPEDVNDFYMYQLYGWSREERDQVFNKYAIDIHWNSSLYLHARDVLLHLYDKHEISFITARPMFCKDITIKWLKYFNIKYHHICFTEDKLAECQKLKVDILIDDAPHYAEEFVLFNKPYILYDQPYNRHVNHELVLRAHHWTEVMEHIETLEYSRIEKI
jgi:uncharacterized HAD superfamily protein